MTAASGGGPLPHVAVVIPTYRRPQLLELLLRSLFQQTYSPERFEIVVVGDTESAPETPAVVQRALGDSPVPLRYLVTTNNAPHKRNVGFANTTAEFIAFTDDDCRADPNWLLELVRTVGDAGGAQGHTIIPRPDEGSAAFYHASQLGKALYPTCNILYRRHVLEEVGGFDERFDAPVREDTDLAFAVLELGYEIRSANDAVIYHHVRPGEPWGILRSARQARFEVLLYKKHPAYYRRLIGSPWSPRSYPLCYAALATVAAGLLTPLSFLLWLGCGLYAAVYALQLGVRLRRGSPRELPTLAPGVVLAPYVHGLSLLLGNLRYGAFLLW